MKNPIRLYHFTKAETALRFILPKEIISNESRLKLNNIGNMNDPKENLLFVTDIDECIINPIERYQLSADSYLIAEYIRKQSKILSFSTDYTNGKFRYGYQLQRMWSQYSLNSTGLCIVLDFEKFINTNSNLIKDKSIIHDYVKYSEDNFFHIPTPMYGMSPENAMLHTPKCLCEYWNDYKEDMNFINKRFFSKNNDWEGELEYRFLAFGDENDSIYMNITDSIEKIILGFNFSKHFLPSLEKLIDSDKIYLLEMRLNEQFDIRKLINN